MSISVKPATIEQKTIIHALLQPYLDELTRFPGEKDGIEYQDDRGTYQYPYLDNYWQEPGVRFPYLLYFDNAIAGFALVRKDNDHWEIGEFYVKPDYRQHKVAWNSASDIFRKHEGPWYIEYNPHNLPASRLWHKLAATYGSSTVNEGKTGGAHDFLRFIIAAEKELFTYYNERAPEYESFYAGEFPTGPRRPDLYKGDTKAIQELLPHYVKGKCVDIACGTGFWLPCYQQNCSAITLIDQSEGVLKECEKKIRDLGIQKKASAVRGDIFRDIPEKGGYDCALAGFIISHFKDDELAGFFKVLREALKPSGSFIIIDSVWGDEAKTYHRDQNGMATRRLYDGRTFQIYKRYFTREELSEIADKNSVTLEIVYWGKVFFMAAGGFQL